LRSKAATVDQLNEVRSEFKKVYDALNIEHLELKSHVWGLEMDLQKVQVQVQDQAKNV
jgi:predicted  nucleic acid-binding Zn-ribbon protein